MAGQFIDMLNALDYVSFNKLLVLVSNCHYWRFYLANHSLNNLFAILYLIFVKLILPPEFFNFAL